jgi:O-antigen/teichoic acid export membrane protein
VARRDRQTLHGRFLESRDAILAVVQLGIAAVVLPSPWFFHLLYDDRYSAASLYAPLLAGAIWFSALQASADRALVALGDNRPLAISNFANLVCTVSGSLLGYQIAEMQGFIAGVALGSFAGHSIISWTLYLRGLSVVAQDLRYTAIVMVTCCISIFQPLNDSRWQIALAVIWFLFSAMYAYRRVGRLAKEALQKILRRIVPQAP